MMMRNKKGLEGLNLDHNGKRRTTISLKVFSGANAWVGRSCLQIRLYDYRLIQREPLQSYEGNVNSHTHIQLGVDPYERFFMSGEEDCNLRLWSIKSSELLFEDNFMDFVPSIVCWLKGTDLGAALVNLEIGVQSWCFVVKVTFCHCNLIIRVSPLSFELEATLKLARFLCW